MTQDMARRPLYARVLRLRHVQPGSLLCFVFLEGSIAVAGLAVLAGLVSVWALLVLPLAVAAAVKLNDVVAGALPGGHPATAPPREGSAPLGNSED